MKLLEGSACLVAAVLAFAAGTAVAEPESPAVTAPRVYALVSAIGDRLTYIQNRMQAGSHMEPYRRSTLKIKDQALNATVLVGLDKELAARHPDSKRVHLALEPARAHAVDPTDREAHAINTVLKALRAMPARSGWDEIIVVTPAFVFGRHDGLSTQLHGIGLYMHPQTTDRLIREKTLTIIDPDDTNTRQTALSPAGVEHETRQYVAIYSYARIWRLDARTLEVISKSDRFDHMKFDDPDSGAVHYVQSLKPAFLESSLKKLVQDSASAGLRQAMGYVELGPLEVLPPDDSVKMGPGSN